MLEKEIVIGTPVVYWGVIKSDGTKLDPRKTVIESTPWALGHGELVCLVKGISGGVSLRHLELDTEAVQAQPVQTGVEVIPPQKLELLPAVRFEVCILGEDTPVCLTPEILEEKAKELLNFEINGAEDKVNYDKCKKILKNLVSTRTSIEGYRTKMTAPLDKRKTELIAEERALVKVVKDYEEKASKKIKAIDDAVKLAKEAADKAEKERTDGRMNKMFELGMLFNGTTFSGYDKSITKDALFSLGVEVFDKFVLDIQGLKEAAECLPPPAPATIAVPTGGNNNTPPAMSYSYGGGTAARTIPTSPTAPAPVQNVSTTATAEIPKNIYNKHISDLGVTVFISVGQIGLEVATALGSPIIMDDQIANSDKFVQVIQLK